MVAVLGWSALLSANTRRHPPNDSPTQRQPRPRRNTFLDRCSVWGGGMKKQEFNLAPIDYKIVLVGQDGKTIKSVSGYAVDTIARICVREVLDSFLNTSWQCDDYDTGCGIGHLFESRNACISSAIAKLEKTIPTGEYEKAQMSVLADLKKRGLLS